MVGCIQCSPRHLSTSKKKIYSPRIMNPQPQHSMKKQALREWLFENSLDDTWYVSSEGNVFQKLFTLKDVDAYARRCPKTQVLVLHTSHANMESPPWINFELSPLKPVKKKTAPQLAQNQNQSWRMRQTKRRQVTKAKAKENKWTPEKIGGVAAIACLLLVFGGIMISAGEEKAPDVVAKAQISSEEAYYAVHPLIRDHLDQTANITFPSHKADGVFHKEVREDMFQMHGYVSIAKNGSRKFESYDMIAQRTDNGWNLVYLKSGPVLVGAIPQNLKSNNTAFVFAE